MSNLYLDIAGHVRARRDRLHAWRSLSANRGIFAAIVTVGGFTMIIRLVSVLKEILVVQHFGVGDALDAYFVAYLLPSVAINVLSASLSMALIPTYVLVRDTEEIRAANRVYSNSLVLLAVLLVATCVGLAMLYPLALPLLCHRFPPAKLALTRGLFYTLLPIIALAGFSSIWAAVLNAQKRFGVAAATPMLTPLVVIAVVIAGGRGLSIYGVATATVIGSLIEAALLAFTLRAADIPVFPRWTWFCPETRTVVKQYLPMVAGSFVQSGNGLVDQTMAAWLSAGSVAALNYGGRQVGLVTGIGATAVGAAAMPYLSQMVAANNWTGVRRTLRIYVGLIAVVSIPVMILLIAGANPLIRALYHRGAVHSSDIAELAGIHIYYALQIPFNIGGILVVRMISSLRANHLLMFAASLNLGLNALLDVVLMKRMGIVGIALSTSIVAAFSFTFCAVALRNRMARISAQAPDA